MKHILPHPVRLSAMLVAMAFAAVSCGPRPVILDTDWWTDVDDAMAVRLALRADERDEIRLMGICVDAAAAEPCADFYSRILSHSRRNT